MFKRWSAAALALLLLGSVAACGEDEDESAAEEASESVEEAGDAVEEAGDEIEEATDD